MKCAASAGCTNGRTITRSSAARSGSTASARWCSRATIIALGVSAARSLTGKTVTIAKMRKAPVAMADGTTLVVTVHPSALLRIEDEADKRAAYKEFVADLKAATGPRQVRPAVAKAGSS